MAVRALIVAIEKYPKASGLATELPGTNDAARGFCKWLADKKGVHPKGSPGYDPRTFFCCAGKEVEFRTHGTTRLQIIRAIESLEKVAKEGFSDGTAATSELYCFFSGHGLSYPRDEIVHDDLFVASNFTTTKKSGGACIKITELIDLLRPALGPGDHYYFFDFCRTEVPFRGMKLSGLDVLFDRVPAEYPGQAVLFSVTAGLAARTDSGFAKHLVDGLGGKGRAKGWYREDLYVKFDFLREYLKKVTKQAVDGNAGSGDGLILKVEPIPVEPCKISVAGAGPTDHFRFEVTRRSKQVLAGEFDGAEHTIMIDQPGDYQLEVFHRSANVERVKPPANALVDLYDPAEAVFRMRFDGLEATSKAPPETGSLTVNFTPNTRIRVRSAQQIGETTLVFANEMPPRRLPPGEYVVEIDEAGEVIARQVVSLSAGESVKVDPLEGPSSPLRDGLLGSLKKHGHSVEFSPQPGGTIADRDLGLWLSLIGASSVVDGWAEGSNFAVVPLNANDESIAPGRAGLLVLAGFETRGGLAAIGLGKRPRWTEMLSAPNVPGLFEFASELDPGPNLVTFQQQNHRPVTLAVNALAGHATLVIFSSGGGLAPIKIYQLFVRIPTFEEQLPVLLRWRSTEAPLPYVVRFIVLLERLFAGHQSISKAMSPERPVEPAWRHLYDRLSEARWLDPIATLIAAHDLLRRGVTNDKGHRAEFRRLLMMTDIYQRVLRAMPDAQALARLMGAKWALPEAPPILADSLTAFNQEEQEAFMPFSNDKRHFGTPWVAWINAVKPYYG
jgi:hypothetical protein